MEKERIEEAKKCESCLCWHKYCNAECCRSISLNVDLKRIHEATNYLIIKVGEINPSDQYYYKLHGIRYTRGTLRFLKAKIKIINGKPTYFSDCKMLQGNLCKLHESGKPELCRDLTLETCHKKDRFLMTENCLFKYKMQGGTNYGKEKRSKD